MSERTLNQLPTTKIVTTGHLRLFPVESIGALSKKGKEDLTPNDLVVLNKNGLDFKVELKDLIEYLQGEIK